MPSWFKKVFSASADTATEPVEQAAAVPEPAPQPVAAPSPPEPASSGNGHRIRNLVNAPVIVPEDERSSWSEDVRIRARVERDGATCTFLVDRPVLDGLSAWFPEAIWAKDVSLLAEKLFGMEGIGTVLLHDTTITLGRQERGNRDWEDVAKEAGAIVREFLKNDEPVVSAAFLNGIPPEDEVRKKIQMCLEMEINPGIAAHSGVITLERVTGNTAYITMGGGCQGCAASTITLRHGIHNAFRRAVPELGAILDETDHASGANPYYSELPAGME